MSPIAIIRNPLEEKENVVFALNNKGGLKIVNTTLFTSQGAQAATPAEVEAGPAFAPSSLTSCLYRNTLCVFGITYPDDITSTTITVDTTGKVVVTPRTAPETGTIAMLSPVFTRFPGHLTNYRSISSVASRDGKDCWIYYRNNTDGALMQLTLPDMSVRVIETIYPIAPGSSLAAFIDSSEEPKVIFQGTDNTLNVQYGVDDGGLRIVDPDYASPDTEIAVTVGTVGTVETVFVYYIGVQGYLFRVKGTTMWSNPTEYTHKYGKFSRFQFAVISDLDKEQNTIYYLDDKLVFKEQKDEYKKIV